MTRAEGRLHHPMMLFLVMIVGYPLLVLGSESFSRQAQSHRCGTSFAVAKVSSLTTCAALCNQGDLFLIDRSWIFVSSSYVWINQPKCYGMSCWLQDVIEYQRSFDRVCDRRHRFSQCFINGYVFRLQKKYSACGEYKSMKDCIYLMVINIIIGNKSI